MTMLNVDVLPAPLGPISPKISPSRICEIELRDGHHAAETDGDPLELEQYSARSCAAASHSDQRFVRVATLAGTGLGVRRCRPHVTDRPRPTGGSSATFKPPPAS